MGEVITIGLDIAKSVFQVHGVDGAGAVVMRKRVSRAKMLEFFGGLPRCLIGDGAYSEVDAAELCKGLSEAQQKRCERCGGDL